VVKMLQAGRALLAPVGEELAQEGRLERVEDIYLLTLPEARAGVAGSDLRAVVRERRESMALEALRRQVPRILLSDGTVPSVTRAVTRGGATDGSMLEGTGASAGTVTGVARVILDPHGARLEPGEILVAPSTDPGWTPLFLTAGGLVMEMGGPMSHGAIVAREYGIPAVVGAPGATERIKTGQTITVDGANGVVTIGE
jgi:rifampicin phosphotransferase